MAAIPETGLEPHSTTQFSGLTNLRPRQQLPQPTLLTSTSLHEKQTPPTAQAVP